MRTTWADSRHDRGKFPCEHDAIEMFHDILPAASTELLTQSRISRQFQHTAGQLFRLFWFDADACLGCPYEIRALSFHPKNDRLLHRQTFKYFRWDYGFKEIRFLKENETDIRKRPKLPHPAFRLLVEHHHVIKPHGTPHGDQFLPFSTVAD